MFLADVGRPHGKKDRCVMNSGPAIGLDVLSWTCGGSILREGGMSAAMKFSGGGGFPHDIHIYIPLRSNALNFHGIVHRECSSESSGQARTRAAVPTDEEHKAS